MMQAAKPYALGLVAAYIFLMCWHSAPLSLTDYANWTYQGVLLHQHLAGVADAAHVLKSYPVPNSAATLGIALLTFCLPWQMAAKAWLCLQMVGSLFVFHHLQQTLKASWAAWVILPPAVMLNINLWYGFVNFELGILWVMLLASFLIRAARGQREVGVAEGVILLMTFFTHIIPLGFCWLLMFGYARQTRRWRVLWQLALTFALTAWYLGGRYLLAGNADGQAGMQASVRDYSAAFWAFKVNSYAKSFGLVNPLGQDLWVLGNGGFFLLLAADLLLAGLMGWLMAKAAALAFAEKSALRFVWVAVGAAVPLFLLAPGAALGISDPGARVLQVALALSLMMSLGCGQRLIPIAAVCSLILGIGGLILFQREAFGQAAQVKRTTSLPQRAVDFAHIPNTDQDYFYKALRNGDMSLRVFPTGMFLNR